MDLYRKIPLETSPRPERVVIGYSELAQMLGRPRASVANHAIRLPLRRWLVGEKTLVFSRDEVEAYLAAKQAAAKNF